MTGRGVVRRLLEAADAVILDIDGVLCVGDRTLPGAAAACQAIRERVAVVIAATNDSRRSRAGQVRRLAAAGLPDADRVLLTSCDATVAALRGDGHRCLAVVGSAGLRHDLRVAGFTLDGVRATALVTGSVPALRHNKDAVLAAARSTKDLPWYATNADLVVPGPAGPVPDAGAVIELMAAETLRRPLICGKPADQMTRAARALLGPVSNVVVVGDGIPTDLAWADAAGWSAIHIGEQCRYAHSDVPCLPSLRAVAAALTHRQPVLE